MFSFAFTVSFAFSTGCLAASFLAVEGLCSATGFTVCNAPLGDGCFMSLSMPYFVGPK